MNNGGLEAVIGVIFTLLSVAAPLLAKRKPKFDFPGTDTIKPEAVNGNGISINSGLLLAQESQGTALKLLSTQVETLSTDIRRRFDEMLLMLADMKSGQDRRLTALEESHAALTRRVYLLENPDKGDEAL